MTTNLVMRPKAFDKDDPRYFEIRTFGTMAYKSVDGDTTKYFIKGVASSSTVDRYGDTLDDKCQKSMLKQAPGLTMWLNHSYDVPEDIAGTCVDPSLKNATQEDGSPCKELWINLEIDPENPRAMKAYQHVERGTKLAFSIGGYFTDFDWDDPDDWWSSLTVHDVELLEISLVGIPANRRAYTKNFGVTMDRLKAECVRRAEEIVKSGGDAAKPQVRMLVRKSFGLSAGEVQPMKKCTETGCEHDAVENTEKCVTHTAPLQEATLSGGGVMLVKSGINGDGTHTAVKCVHEPACASFEAHLAAPAPDPTPAELTAQLETVRTALAAEQVTLDAVKAEHATLTATHTTMSAEIAILTTQKTELEQQVEKLKATPTGRSTRSSHTGGSSGSEPTASPELYAQSSAQLGARAAQTRAATDARATLQR